VATESARKKLRGKRDALLDSSTQSSSSQSILSQSQTDEDVRQRIFNPANVPLAGAECGILEPPPLDPPLTLHLLIGDQYPRCFSPLGL
jgi:hypothetical protein